LRKKSEQIDLSKNAGKKFMRKDFKNCPVLLNQKDEIEEKCR